MNFNKSYTEDIEFQVILSLAIGILLAPFSWGIMYTVLFVIIFEAYVFTVTSIYPPSVAMMDRVIINLVFFFGWILGRIFYCNETGFEEVCNTVLK